MSLMRRHLTTASVATSLVLTACGGAQSPTSSLKVTNGALARSAYPSVVALHLTLPDGEGTCTGTFITDTQVLSAAHCVYDVLTSGGSPSALSFEQYHSDGSTTHVAAVSLAYNPLYNNDPTRLSNHDMSVITFPPGSAPATSPLYAQDPQIGQAFTIVGYGLNDYEPGNEGTGAGVKRLGTNTIRAIDNNMIEFYGATTASVPGLNKGQNSASGSGDSGGPLFIGDAVAATTVGGGVEQVRDTSSGEMLSLKASNYLEIGETNNRAFLAQQLSSTPGW